MVDAREFHERTNHTPAKLRESDFALDPETRPESFKTYRELPRQSLPAIRATAMPALSAVAKPRADPLAGTEQARVPDIDRRMLATLCYEAAGILQRATARNGREHSFRSASCTGNLHHIDLYPVCGPLGDLPAGVYHFDPEEMALDVLREGDYRGVIADAVGRSGDDGGDAGVATAPVTFVATSTWWRNAWKYRDRTYRHAFWDSGTVLANLFASAHANDQRSEVVAAFADRPVVELLGVDPETEGPVALAPVGTGEQAPDPPAVGEIDPETEPLSPEQVDYPLIHDAWAESTIPDGETAAELRHDARDFDGSSAEPGDGDWIPLEPVDDETATSRPLHATIRRRRSCREYAAVGPTRRQVATVLDRATRGVPGDWNGASGGLAFNDLYLLATGVDGIPDGSYRFYPEQMGLERLGEVTEDEQARLALGQDWAGDAHLNVYMLADIEGIVDRVGDRGYRLAQLEAGITLGRLYLATYAHRELGGLGLTFFDELVAEQFEDRAGGKMPTCLYAFGRATE